MDAIRLHKEGVGTNEIARRLHATPSTVCHWKKAWKQGGDAALAAKPAPGRPPKLNVTERKRLVTMLLKGAAKNGFSTDVWTCQRIVEIIRKKFHVEYHADHVSRLMRGLGFSCQKPERLAAERDEEAISGWIKQDWPRIKKSPKK
jgi:transposase